MKKKVLLILSFVLVAILVTGITFALLTSEASNHNVMTVGKAKIEQLEYQREVDKNGEWIETDGEYDVTFGSDTYRPDKLVEFVQDELLLPTTTKSDDFKWDDRNGNSNPSGQGSHQQSWAEVGAPGSNQLFDDSVTNVKDKFVFVKNTGSINVYYRTIIAIEAPEGHEVIHTNINGNSRFDWEHTEMDGMTQAEKDDVEHLYVTIDGTRYKLMVATYNQILAPQEISRPSLLQLYMDYKADNEDVEAYGDKVDVLVFSQAVQAKGFKDADTALNDAFGDITEKNHPWIDGYTIIENEEDLREFLANGGYGVLVNDIEVSEDLANAVLTLPSVNGKELTLNTNGHKLTNASSTTNKSNFFINLGKDSSLTLTGNGEMELNEGTKSGQNNIMLSAGSNAELTIDGGTYTATGTATGILNNVVVYANGDSIVTINDGNFYATGEKTSLIIASGNAVVYIKGGFFESEGYANKESLNVEKDSPNAAIIVSGGTFVNFDPSKEDESQVGQVKLADGYKVVSETQTNGDVWYKVIAK